MRAGGVGGGELSRGNLLTLLLRATCNPPALPSCAKGIVFEFLDELEFSPMCMCACCSWFALCACTLCWYPYPCHARVR